MGDLFVLTPDILALATQGLDSIINQLGKECLLIYSPKMNYCTNCRFDPIGNKSSNIWVSGGSVPFSSGICPLCNGKGLRAEQVTKLIKMLVHTDPKTFYPRLPPMVEVPAGTVQTKCYLTDLPGILQAQEMIIQPDLGPLIKAKYRLSGNPANPSNIIQMRYAFCLWNRIAT